ncbi:protein O-linked-mannose beta-1,2-N-acetylglucosaminyltransferase 1-like [Pollicipes pollicipes]|uniref:protein O-linked-mannose beta-1,2-N-acetylglucosaminyltransferase 1-like n=1 Tax=Pollicipes pollicipes TaxID=41117 RepID=UPI0018852443|nr:protein O-linked-mannose beta-1,2-N-acetylglucosaminyltransferase 1-like [Pollicipes pollicipes]
MAGGSVESGEDKVDIQLDGQSLMVPETNNRTRGLHVLVLEQNTGAVLARRRFDTVLSAVHEEAVRFLDAVRPGRLLVLATKGAGEALGESFSPAPAHGEFGGPLFLRVDLRPDTLPPTPPCQWADSEESRRRHAFCDKFEGYPGVCRCLQPHPVLPAPSALDENIDSIYVAVMATHRPYYLYRSLRSLAFAQGVQPGNVVVYLENDKHPELEALVALFGFQSRYVAAKSSTKINFVISNRIMDILNDAFTAFMEAEFVMFIEEDLECSPDIFRYFGQAQQILREDPSVFSVSAFNLHSFANTSHATNAAYRVDNFTGLGFLLPRKTYEHEAKPLWLEYAWKSEFDLFMDKKVKKDREVIVPDVNRVYHIGRDSHYINTNVYDMLFKNLSVNPDPTSQLHDVTRLYKLNYEEDLKVTLKRGVTIRDYGDICNAGNMTFNFQNQCWGLGFTSTAGHHGGLWRFWLENKKGFLFHMVFIGVPFSRYS